MHRIIPLKQAAKQLCKHPGRLYQYLKQQRIIDEDCLPAQRYINGGYLTMSETIWYHPDIGRQVRGKCLVTPRGMRWLHGIIRMAPKTLGLAPRDTAGQSRPEREVTASARRMAWADTGTPESDCLAQTTSSHRRACE